MTAQAFHYFATTAYGWQAAESREAAIKGAVVQGGLSTLKAAKKVQPGLQGTVVRVNLPLSAKYTINDYLPQTLKEPCGDLDSGARVPLAELENLWFTGQSGQSKPREVTED